MNRRIRLQRLGATRNTGKAIPVSSPPPIGGWNTRDALNSMPPTDAVLLDNWFPTTGKVTVRKGYTEFIGSGMGSGNVDTLAEFHAGSVRKFIAATNSNLYEISSGTASSIGSGYSSDQWQWVNFNGSIFLVNGQDAPLDYDGTTLSATSWTGSGLTISDLIGVNVFKNRLFFWEDDSQDFWYAGPASVTGTLTKFPLSRVGQFGGNLVTMATWTFDGGAGPDDVAVFIMSSGEVIVYQGDDPGDADFWSLIGVYRIGTPINRRGVVKVGGDLVIMTWDDYVSLSEVLQTGQIGNPSKLSGAVKAASLTNSADFGWQALLYKQGEMIVFNVPTNDADGNKQHIFNTTTKAATRFKGINARCFGIYNSNLYFGSTDGKVYQADTGANDDGGSISADGRTAWSSFTSNTSGRVSAVRPVLEAQGQISFESAVGYDYQDALAPAPSSSVPGDSLWDTAIWDVATWAGESLTSLAWKAARGYGQSISLRVRVNALQVISWIRTDYRIEPGRNL